VGPSHLWLSVPPAGSLIVAHIIVVTKAIVIGSVCEGIEVQSALSSISGRKAASHFPTKLGALGLVIEIKIV